MEQLEGLRMDVLAHRVVREFDDRSAVKQGRYCASEIKTRGACLRAKDGDWCARCLMRAMEVRSAWQPSHCDDEGSTGKGKGNVSVKCFFRNVVDATLKRNLVKWMMEHQHLYEHKYGWNVFPLAIAKETNELTSIEDRIKAYLQKVKYN